MKKQLLLIVMVLLPIVASAYDARIDGIYYNFNSANKTATVTFLYNSTGNISAYSGEIIIPCEVTWKDVNYKVTNIGRGAFSGCSGLTSIEISNSVTNIDENAFSGCSGLSSIVIPNSVISIERSAFYNCSGLTSLTIPNSVTSIGDYAFCRCSGLTSITIPNTVESIGGDAFSNCI